MQPGVDALSHPQKAIFGIVSFSGFSVWMKKWLRVLTSMVLPQTGCHGN